MLKMNTPKPYWYLILLVLVVVVMVGINELGYGIFSLLVLFSAYWLVLNTFEEDKPGN